MDNDKGEAGETFSGGTGRGANAHEHNQEAYGSSNGTNFDGDPIQPLAALPGQENPDDQIMAIGVGEPVHTVGYGFTYEPVPGETVSFNYKGYDNSLSYESDSLYVEGEAGGSGSSSGGSGTSGGSGPSGGGSDPSAPCCFTRGTATRTARGEVLVEDLIIGDAIWTEAHGTLSESFFPDAPSIGDVDSAPREELFALFPELETSTHGHSIAYPGLMPHEMALLVR